MRVWRVLLALAGAAVAIPAHAQEAAAPKPCTHSAQQMRLGGLDPTELQCRLLVAQQRIHNLEDELIAYQSAGALTVNDHQQREEGLAAWFKGWFGEAAKTP